MNDHERINIPSLVTALIADVGSAQQVATRLQIKDPRTVLTWSRDERNPSTETRVKIIEFAQQRGMDVYVHADELQSVYDFRAPFEENLLKGPHNLPRDLPQDNPICPVTIWGDRILASPVGVPASVLTVDSRWIANFLKLGYDVIEYKTVRTREYKPHATPNVFHLNCGSAFPPGEFPTEFTACHSPPSKPGNISISNSFGMPSPPPAEWQADIRKTQEMLDEGQMLIVSIVGTAEEASIRDHELHEDFARCAELAKQTNPSAISINLSCPNTHAKEGNIYQDPQAAREVCTLVREACPDQKILAKIGYLPPEQLRVFFDQTVDLVDGYIAINSRPALIHADSAQLQGGKPAPAYPSVDDSRHKAGVSGIAIQASALETIDGLNRLRAGREDRDLLLIGVGGVSNPNDFLRFRRAGADIVQSCTAVIFNPFLGLQAKRLLAEEKGGDPDEELRVCWDALATECNIRNIHLQDVLELYRQEELSFLALPAGIKKRNHDWPRFWRDKLNGHYPS